MLNALRHQWLVHKVPSINLFVGLLSAQRLTASMVGSRVVVDYQVFIKACSTPYGINGWFTGNGEITGGDLRCAQRLTASMVGSHSSRDQLEIHKESAQRLTASMVGSHRHPWW